MPYLSIIGLLIILIGADQGIKMWVTTNVQTGQSEQLISGVLALTNLHNHGAAWSILQGRMNFFIIISVLAIIVLIYYLIKLHHKISYDITISFMMAGTCGNFIDRIRYGYVVDMFQVEFNLPLLHFVFNFADACLTIGVIQLLILLWRSDNQGHHQ